jgi:hypothetical protein
MQEWQPSASLKVFRRGPQRDGCHRVLVAHVDKPRKDEAAGGVALPMGKERRRRGSHGSRVVPVVRDTRRKPGLFRQLPRL